MFLCPHASLAISKSSLSPHLAHSLEALPVLQDLRVQLLRVSVGARQVISLTGYIDMTLIHSCIGYAGSWVMSCHVGVICGHGAGLFVILESMLGL